MSSFFASRCRVTGRSTASLTLCHKCQRLAPGAPRAVPSNGTVRYQKSPSTTAVASVFCWCSLVSGRTGSQPGVRGRLEVRMFTGG
jgi:hypothetical protein